MSITNLPTNLTSKQEPAFEVDKTLTYELKLYYSENERVTREYILRAVLPKFDKHQIIIFDNKRTWTPDKLQIRTRIIIPHSREDLVSKLVELRKYFTPRLKLILVDNFQYYFRDYEGKDRKILNNQRLVSFLINLLRDYSKQSIEIILTGYRDPLNHSRPLMETLLSYYEINWIHLRDQN